MLKKIAIGIVALIAIILIVAATRPNEFHVERATTIHAPPEKVFALVNDFHNWGSWSPWEKLDTAMKRTYSGTPAGVGSVYEWEGNSDVGAGRMEITEATPQKVAVKLDFLKPFEGHNVATFVMQPVGDSTKVMWLMDGPSPFVAKVMGVFVSMDKMIGKDFEAGLGNLKKAAEQ